MSLTENVQNIYIADRIVRNLNSIKKQASGIFFDFVKIILNNQSEQEIKIDEDRTTRLTYFLTYYY